jgi:acyl-CoA reductase-like NAD-dependent aldehyde dehydrogenase
MLKMADIIDSNAKDIAPLETIAMGQPTWLTEQLLKLAAEAWRCKSGL